MQREKEKQEWADKKVYEVTLHLNQQITGAVTTRCEDKYFKKFQICWGERFPTIYTYHICRHQHNFKKNFKFTFFLEFLDPEN